MRITLISPYPNITSLGVRSLSSYLKTAGHQTRLLFLPGDFKDRYNENVLDEVVSLSKEADLIGISLMTNFFDSGVQLTQRLQKELDIPILWGGIHPTTRPRECLKHADMVCIGEAEQGLLELVQRMENGRNYYDTKNVWFKAKGQIIENRLHPLIQDLDLLPFPDYDLEEHFILHEGNIHKMDNHLLQEYLSDIYLTMTSRGCIYDCTYCCNNALNKLYPIQKRFRRRSVRNVIEELLQVKKKMGFIKIMLFEDDAFFAASSDEIKRFCEEYKQTIGLPLIISGATPATISEEKVSALVNAGLVHVRMGIETGSEKTKELYNRNFSNHRIIEATKVLNRFKSQTKVPVYDLILDNPWEDNDDLIKTLKLLLEIPRPYRLNLFSLTFFPGTQLYEKAKSEGIITDDLREIHRKDYLDCEPTYLNGLFYLLSSIQLPAAISKLLMSKKVVDLELNWLFYVFKLSRILMLLREGIRDAISGDFSRIKLYILGGLTRKRTWHGSFLKKWVNRATLVAFTVRGWRSKWIDFRW